MDFNILSTNDYSFHSLIQAYITAAQHVFFEDSNDYKQYQQAEENPSYYIEEDNKAMAYLNKRRIPGAFNRLQRRRSRGNGFQTREDSPSRDVMAQLKTCLPKLILFFLLLGSLKR